MRKQQDNNFKIKLFTDTKYRSMNFFKIQNALINILLKSIAENIFVYTNTATISDFIYKSLNCL